MRVNTLFIVLLFVTTVPYSQSLGGAIMEGDKKVNPARELIYEKIVHFTVKQDRRMEFIDWVKEHQEEFAESLPPGWKFLGCYRTMFHSGKHAWQFRYEMEGMGAYDNLILYESDALEGLFEQIYDFIDLRLPLEVEIVKKIEHDTGEVVKDK
jgi:hypothetical protein